MINPTRHMCRSFAWALAVFLGMVVMPFTYVLASDFTFPMHDRASLPLGAIEIAGNAHTNASVIEHIMGFKLGQSLSSEQVYSARDRLEDSGYFRTVDIDLDDSGDQSVLRVKVEEDLTTFYGPVMRYDRRYKYLLGGYMEQKNFRGHGEKLRLEASALYIQQAKAAWDRPWFLNLAGLSAHLDAGYTQGDFVYRPTRFRKWHTHAEVTHKWHDVFSAIAGVSYGQFKQRDTFTWAAHRPYQSSPSGTETLNAHLENYWMFEGALRLDSRSNPYYPRQGLYVEGRLRQWSSNDFASYLEASVDSRFFVSLPWQHHILAMHAWGRRTDGPAQLDNMLYFGGPETVRGEPYALREGDEGYLLSIEYRVPLFLMPISPQGELVGVGFHVFADAGDAWFDGTDPGRALRSAGAGLHLNLNTLQLRFEAARTAEGHWGFEFMDKFNF